MNLTIRSQTLPPGAVIDDWIVGECVGIYGDACFYRARHAVTGHVQIIQEYFPAALVRRRPDGTLEPRNEDAEQEFLAGQARFHEVIAALEARAKSLTTTAAARVCSVHQSHGTVYMVADRPDGPSLAAELAAGRRFDEDDLLRLIRPIVAMLSDLHAAGVCHLGIRPAAILLSGSSAMLGEFATLCTPQGLVADEDPYRPIELIVPVAPSGPWSDIYSLGATLFHCMTGEPPPPASNRIGDVSFPADVQKRFSSELLNAVMLALACVPSRRPQSIDQWLGHFSMGPEASSTDSVQAEAPASTPVQDMARLFAAAKGPAEVQGAGKSYLPALPPFGRQMIRPVIGTAVMLVAIQLVISFTSGRMEEPAVRVQGLPSVDIGLAPKVSKPQEALPMLQLAQELTTARAVLETIESYARQAADYRWPKSRIDALRHEASRASAAFKELRSLEQAQPGSQSREAFVAVMEAQTRTLKSAQAAAWKIALDGYVADASRWTTNGRANYRQLTAIVGDTKAPKHALLRDAADLAHKRLNDAFAIVKDHADAPMPVDPLTVGQRLAQVAVAYNQVSAEAKILREALQSGERLAEAAEAEAKVAARERRAFQAALQAARGAAKELETIGQPSGQARDGGEARLADRSNSNAQDAKNRLDNLERAILRSPEVEPGRVQVATLEVRELEKALRSLLVEVRSKGLASPPAPNLSPAILRLVKKADSRIERNYKRFRKLQDAFADQGDMRQKKSMEALNRSLSNLAATREQLATARSERDAERLYKQFQTEHDAVDSALDRLNWLLVEDRR